MQEQKRPDGAEETRNKEKAAITRSAFVALIGRPNVGKSSLLNAAVGKKVAIVSDKPQTTRNRIMGVRTRDGLQLVFLDTPGAHKPRTRLGDFMVKSIGDAISGVDAAVMVVEPSDVCREQESALLERCAAQKLPVVLAVNKIDTVEDKSALLVSLDAWSRAFPFAAAVPLSAHTGDGVDTLVSELSAFAFESPHFFPDDTVSDQPERVVVAEVVREKILRLLRDEVPHGVAVTVESLSERQAGGRTLMDIEATIFCERDSHKGIIIGRGGAMLREIGTRSREELETLFGVKVNLQCWVKVKEDWRNRQGLLNGLGYQ